MSNKKNSNSNEILCHNLYLAGLRYEYGCHGYQKNLEKAREFFKRASSMGCELSTFRLHEIYFHGLGVEADLEYAKKLYSMYLERRDTRICQDMSW